MKPAREPFRLMIETVVAPSQNQALMGLYLSNGVYCTQAAQKASGITISDRPDILPLHGAHRGAARPSCRFPTAIPESVENSAATGIGRLARSASEAVLSVRAGCGDSADKGPVRHRIRPGGRSRHLCGARQGESRAATPWTLQRSMQWDEEVSGREMISTPSTSSPSRTSTRRDGEQGLNIFNDNTCLRMKRPLRTPTSPISRRSSRTSISTIGQVTESLAGTGSSCLKEGLTVYRDHEFPFDQRRAPSPASPRCGR